jgi:hypothetical protein
MSAWVYSEETPLRHNIKICRNEGWMYIECTKAHKSLNREHMNGLCQVFALKNRPAKSEVITLIMICQQANTCSLLGTYIRPRICLFLQICCCHEILERAELTIRPLGLSSTADVAAGSCHSNHMLFVGCDNWTLQKILWFYNWTELCRIHRAQSTTACYHCHSFRSRMSKLFMATILPHRLSVS